MIRNKLDKPFGPFGTWTGFFMLTGGLITSVFSFLGLLPLIIGAFIFFTGSSTYIDTGKKRVRHSDDVFGFIHTGRWIDIIPGMTVAFKILHKGYRGYIRGTYPVDIHQYNAMIYLFDPAGKPVLPLKKLKPSDDKNRELENLSRLLDLPVLKSKN